jgi:superfamily II DNA/RNA helicase
MPKKIQDFARSALVKPVIVNVGRAGAANLDVIQEVEYVKQEAKIVYLLECLQKTPPPVIIEFTHDYIQYFPHFIFHLDIYYHTSSRYLFLQKIKMMWMIFTNTF